MLYILFRKYFIVFTCELFAGCDNKKIIIVTIPEGVINVNGTTTTWEVPVITDRTVPANRHDTVGLLHDKKEKTCLLIDII